MKKAIEYSIYTAFCTLAIFAVGSVEMLADLIYTLIRR